MKRARSGEAFVRLGAPSARASRARLTRPSPRPAPRAPATRGTSTGLSACAIAQLRKCAHLGISAAKSVNGLRALHDHSGRRLGCERARVSARKLAFARLLNAALITRCAGWANGDMGGRCVHGAGARARCRAEDLLSCSQRDAVTPFVAPTQDVSQSGIWNLESGTWNLEPGTWNLEPGIWSGT